MQSEDEQNKDRESNLSSKKDSNKDRPDDEKTQKKPRFEHTTDPSDNEHPIQFESDEVAGSVVKKDDDDDD